MTVYDVPINELILKAAEELKNVKDIMPPSWADFVKTGTHKERPPVQKDWWYIRAASILNTINRLGPVGVSKLRTKYGGKKNMGYRPERFRKGSGNIIRKILQQLEKAGLAKRVDKGVHKGRVITPQGLALLGKVANAIMVERKIIIPQKSTEEIKGAMPRKIKKASAKTAAPRKRRAKKAEAPAGELAAGEAPAAGETAEKKPRKRRAKKAEAPAAASVAEVPAESAKEAVE